MTIDETIKHYEKLIEQNNFLIKTNDSYNFSQLDWKNENKEYRQLIEWLKDYKRLKEQEPRKGYWDNKRGIRIV